MWRRFAAPLLYLFFLVPFGEFLIPPLQSLAVRFTTVGLSLLGIPNFADGIVIEIPEGTFLVHQACSGLRFLIASAAFSVFFACLIYTSPLRRALFIAAAFVVAVIANDFRVLGIIVIAHFIGNAQAIETGHVLWGWLFYVIVGSVLVLMGLAFRQERRSPIRAKSSRPRPLPPLPGRSNWRTCCRGVAGHHAAGGGKLPRQIRPRLNGCGRRLATRLDGVHDSPVVCGSRRRKPSKRGPSKRDARKRHARKRSPSERSRGARPAGDQVPLR